MARTKEEAAAYSLAYYHAHKHEPKFAADRKKADAKSREVPVRDKPWGLVSTLLGSAKYRAKRDGLPFLITHTDIVIPAYCPILKVELARSTTGKVTNASPSLDKIIPELGYVPGNVRVISAEANRLKDANTIATLEALLAYCRGEI